MPDLTVITYARDSQQFAAFLNELFGRKDTLELELTVVDGGAMTLDFEKIHGYCRERGVQLSIVRQDPVDSAVPGYHVAVRQAKAPVVVCVEPGLSVPDDFFFVARKVGLAGYCWLPRPEINMVFDSSEVRTSFGPPAANTICFPRAAYDSDMLGDTTWKRTIWAKADAYLLATQFAKANPRMPRMATMTGLCRRSWVAASLSHYAVTASADQAELGANLLHDTDVRLFSRGIAPWEKIGTAVRPFQSQDEVTTIVTNASMFIDMPRTIPERDVPVVRDRLMAALSVMFAEGQLMVLPECDIVKDADGNYRIKSTGRISLPFEL